MFSTLLGSPPAGEDLLDGLFQPDVERDPDGVGVLEKAARQRDDRLRGCDQP
jgi:hypothetical protein